MHDVRETALKAPPARGQAATVCRLTEPADSLLRDGHYFQREFRAISPYSRSLRTDYRIKNGKTIKKRNPPMKKDHSKGPSLRSRCPLRRSSSLRRQGTRKSMDATPMGYRWLTALTTEQAKFTAISNTMIVNRARL